MTKKTMTTIRSTFPEWVFDNSSIDDPFGYGERAVKFLRAMKHPKSTLPKKAFQLDPWQERIVRRTYGPRHSDGRRIINTVVILVPKGNRKTSLAAALALLHTIGPERVPGGEAIFAASDKKQAGIAFKEARGIIKCDRRLAKIKVYDPHNSAKKIEYREEATELEVVSSDAPSQDGRTPAFVLADEIHVWRGNELWKVLTNGLDKIDNSLLVVTTTSGRGHENIAYEVIDRARKIARGDVVDPTVLPVLFESQADCDIYDEANWRRVNPGSSYGYPSLAGFRRHVARARDSITERESLKQLKLGIWLDHSTSPFVPMPVYDEGANSVDIATLKDQPCWLAVDLSSNSDLTAIVAAWRDKDDGYIVHPWFFCPADNLRRRGEKDGVNYPAWAEQGFITPTDGNVVDFRVVEAKIRELYADFNVQEIAFDPHLARNTLNNLLEDGLPAVEMRQGWVTMAPAVKELERAIIGRKFKHGGHPILRWHFDNIAVDTDKVGNRMFHKGKSKDRIDGAVATAMAVARAAAGEEHTSIYSSPSWSDDLAVI